MRGAAAALLGALLAAPAAAIRPSSADREDARRFGAAAASGQARRAPRAAAFRELARLNERERASWRLRFDPRTGEPRALLGGRSRVGRGRPSEQGRRFLESQRGLLGLEPSDLAPERESFGSGHRHALFRQRHRGLPVEFSAVKVHLDADGSVTGVDSTYEPGLSVAPAPALAPSAAAAAAEADAGGRAHGDPELVVLPPGPAGGSARLAWKVKVRGRLAAWRYYVDALDGKILLRYNALRFAPPVCLTSGVVTGMVYDVDPTSTPVLSRRPFNNLEVHIADASTSTTTYADSTYGEGFFCSPTQGKVVMSLQGPYVSVSNFRQASAHYDNGAGVWATAAGIASQQPYSNSTTYISTISLSSLAPSAVKFLPVFSAFSVGAFSGGGANESGDVTDNDEVTIYDSRSRPIASYVGSRGAFHGAAVHGRSLNLALVANDAGSGGAGYAVAYSSYLALTSPFTYGAAGTSSHTWVPGDAPIGLRGEMNLFYHLNAMRDYFAAGPNASGAAPIPRPVVAMSHVGPTMSNAFYDPERDNLMFGDVSGSSPSDLFTEDATVPRHEYVHYLVEKIWSIQNFGQAGAISEAVADYFAASSLGFPLIGQHVVAGLGGSGVLRSLDCGNLAGRTCKSDLNAQWVAEIHDDSEFLSQALWELRQNRIAALGASTGRACADGLVFQALLSFPEGFEEFHDALLRADAAGASASCGGAGTAASAITARFQAHGLLPASGDAYERNDGFESAVDASTLSVAGATVDPSGDADFWSFGAGPGLVKLTLDLPADGAFYKAYQLKLYDRSRRLVASAAPPYNGIRTVDGVCDDLDCTSQSSRVVLQYNNPAGGQLFAHVSGGDSAGGSASGVRSSSPYLLRFEYNPASALAGSIVSASFDNDLFSYSVEVASFVSVQDWRFAYAQLRDQAAAILPETRTDQGGAYLSAVTAQAGGGRLSGTLRLNAGFAARFPASGTVHLEIFGYNVSGSTVSLGLSNPLNVTARQAGLAAYNNLFNPGAGEKATIQYATTSAGRLTVKLYTVSGIHVATLFDGAAPAGRGTVDWDGRNIAGAAVASGVYVVRALGPGLDRTQKIAVVK